MLKNLVDNKIIRTQNYINKSLHNLNKQPKKVKVFTFYTHCN